MRKTRPCVIISPDEMNKHIRTIIIAPMTSTIKNYPTRVTTTFQGKKGQVVLDQIRTIDKHRLIKKIWLNQQFSRREGTQCVARNVCSVDSHT
ncbi:MAG: type II toxin-antitoxin system PemK/MazF family toxin [Bacteroidetes bacterium]|nr:type II toxin-antitoxin system PemK/MazF family toxin [Bacteroidota bacterium]